MKTIGLIGGMSWESSAQYYRIINETVRRRLGGQQSARSVLVSVNFADVEAMQRDGRWDAAAELLRGAAWSAESAGADVLLLGTNTMHKVAPSIQEAVSVPLLHIADATADRIAMQPVRKVGLLGTRFTMEEEFYRRRLCERHGLEVCVPGAEARELVHRVIYDELCRGVVRSESHFAYQRIMSELVEAGAEGIVLGCTEIELLVTHCAAGVPVFPTTRIHAETAVDWAIGEG